jgi:hypothetical protein
MLSRKILTAVALASAAAGCLPSGPGGFHTEPTEVSCEEPIELEWKQIIRGYHGSGVEKRYSDEVVFYRTSPEGQYRRAKLSRRVGTDKADEALFIRASIPPIPCEDGDAIEYYLSIKFDGHKVRSPMRGFAPDSPRRVPVR